jgi:hypothetical protein
MSQPESIADPIEQACLTQRWEIARRLCLQALQAANLTETETNLRLRQLHDAYAMLGDFSAADAALRRIAPTTREEAFELALTAALDLDRLCGLTFYRVSDDAKAGHTFDVYQEKLRKKVQLEIDRAISLAETPERKERAAFLLQAISQRSEGLSPKAVLTRNKKPGPIVVGSSEMGSLFGEVHFEDGSPAAGVTVTLGLRVHIPHPDPATHLILDMTTVQPEVGPLQARVAQTDSEGQYRFETVPAELHEFLAVTLDPEIHDIPTRFLKHGVEIHANSETRMDLMITEWISAAPREVIHPFQDKMQRGGRSYRLVHQLVLKNPFYFNFPRQAISLPLTSSVQDDRAFLLLSSTEMQKPQPFQIGREGLTFFTELPQKSDRVFALYETDGPVSDQCLCPDLALSPDVDGKTAVIDTGTASFRIAYGKGTDATAPLLAVRGANGIWRGHGRFRLPDHLTVLSRETRILETGPLALSVRIEYRLSNQTTYSWLLTAHRNEAYLLVKEISPEIEEAAFDFSLREFSGGRGYLHWKSQVDGNDQHWTDLKTEECELARIQESVAWWLFPQGFAYGMTPGEPDQNDFVAVFSRRRGEWIDHKFARISQGPGDAERELDWPFPEMVGSTVSMITAHTDTSGDAYFHFGFFDGERQWGILVSEVEKNDGPFKELSEVQHKNSSPRLQDYKDWHLDKQDTRARPFVIAHRKDLTKLRKKKSSPFFAKYWDRTRTGQSGGGPQLGLLFAVDHDPLAAWQKKLELIHAAEIRSKMTLLGRDFGDYYSPVGARPVAPWAESYDLIVASGCFTPDEERLVRQFLILMGHMYMEPDLMNWKYNSRNANFEADRIDLVGTVGVCFLGHPDSKKFIDHCIGLMERSLNVYCTPDSGKWYENPACYYLHASKCRMNLVFHLFRHGLFDATKIPRLKDFLRWGVLLLTPRCPSSYEAMRDGLTPDEYLEVDRVRRIAPIGDHAHLGPWVPDYYATAAKIYRESDPDFSDLLLAAYNEGGSDGGYFGNAPLVFAALSEEDLRPVKLPELPGRRLEGFGAVIRDHFGTDKEFYLLLKQGPAGYRYHRTEGGIILFANSQPLVYEGGEAGDTWRHSTLSFYEADMPLACGHVERFHTWPQLSFVQGVHPVAIKPGDPIYLNDNCHHTLVATACRRFAEPNPVDVRSIFVVRDEYIVMHDDLRLAPDVSCRWHLQAVANAHKGSAASGYLFQGRFGTDLQVLFPGQSFIEETVEHLSIHDFKAASEVTMGRENGFLFKEHHSPVLRPANECFATRHLMVRAEKPDCYLAILRPLIETRKPARAEALVQGDRIIGARIKAEGIDDLIFSSRETFAYTTDGVHFEGKYGAFLRRAQSVQLFLLAGVSLAAEGFRITSKGPVVRLEVFASHIEITSEGSGRFEIEGLGAPRSFELVNDRIETSLRRD